MPQIFPSSIGGLYMMIFFLFLVVVFKFYWLTPNQEMAKVKPLKGFKQQNFFIKW
nr:ATP synthase 8 [Actornithophilus hoplopteri]